MPEVRNVILAIALDLGSTSIKAGLLDQQGELSNLISIPAPIVYADGMYYESDALAYAEVADQALSQCLVHAGGYPPLGLCSQRSSFVIWVAATGIPVTPLVSWQDSRGAASCLALQSQESAISRLSGLRLAPYFFAPKLRVVLLENPDWRNRLVSGELMVGTLDTFLIWRWTGGKHHIVDVSMAARTLLMDIHSQQWSAALCDIFGIPVEILPKITPSTGLNLPLANGLHLQASLGDQSAALVASVGDNSEAALVNLGTGGFVMRYLEAVNDSSDGYLRTLVYQDNSHTARIAIEGTLNSIAAGLAPYPVADCRPEHMAQNKDIFALAEPSGLGAPFFRGDIELQFSASIEQLAQNQICCLLLEAIVFRVVRILEDFNRGGAIKRVYLTGGLSGLAALQQGIAQCVHQEVFHLQHKDASLQGAAMLAVGLNRVTHKDLVKVQLVEDNRAMPEKYQRWKLWLDKLLAT